jgi:hypothetical protein
MWVLNIKDACLDKQNHAMRYKPQIKKRRNQAMRDQRFVSILLVLIAFVAVAGTAFADTVIAPERSQGLVAPGTQATHNLVTLQGPGKFVAAEISKQGGTNDLTFVSLDIDGKKVVNSSIAALNNWALTQHNPYGIVLLKSSYGIETVTIGYPSTLTFNKSLSLSVTVKEPNVVQIISNVIHGK